MLKNKKGSAVAYSLVVIVMVSIVLSSVVQFVANQNKVAYQEQSKAQAFQIAEAGVNFYRWYLAHQTDGKNSTQVRDFWQSTSPAPYGTDPEHPFEKEFVDAEGSAIGKFRISVEKPVPSSTIVNATVIGWTYKYENLKKTIKVRFRRPSWSEDAVLIDEFTKFGNGWDVRGKIMSNVGVHFDGVAHNTIYAGLATYYDSDSDVRANKPGVWTVWPNEYNTSAASEVFLGGKQFPYAQKDFSGVTTDLTMMKDISMAPGGATVNGCTAGGCHFTIPSGNEGKHIILKSNGTFDIKTVKTKKGGANYNAINTESSATNYPIPTEGVIFVDGDTWVEGIINNKRVTIVAAFIPATATDANIMIGTGHLRYSNFDGRDVVGLIAQGDIETLHNGLNNLVINAALLAQNGMVGQNDRNPDCCSAVCAGLKSNVTFYGSIASKHRLVILLGRYKCDSYPYYGYLNRAVQYDNNLLNSPPPYFPTGTQYAVDQWEEQ
ncbi:MAG: PilX N-terminal domain-containing pilus assembly protein [Candidatus Moraniibacteriota bacterium]